MAELIVPPALRERHRAASRAISRAASPWSWTAGSRSSRMRRDGCEFPCELTITRIALPGDPVFVGYLRDITDRQTAEADLRASRARIVDAGDDARRKLERDLHDGAQQRLVGLALALRLARRRLRRPGRVAAAVLDSAIGGAREATAALRDLARGMHPAVLIEGGLEHALPGLAKRARRAGTLVHAVAPSGWRHRRERRRTSSSPRA